MENAFVTQARADPDRVEVRNPRSRWLALVRRFRRGLSVAGVALRRGLFPIQTIRSAHGLSATALHDRLAARGVRAVLHGSAKGQPHVSFSLTSRHTPVEIDTAVRSIAAASRVQPLIIKEVNLEEPVYH